jgi:predicted ABC-type ATPase
MTVPELTFVVGPNAAGKSSFIRTRINELEGCEIIMTDVYKGRTKEVFSRALKAGKDIILETIFNDASFKDLVDQARHAGYHTSLIILFLDAIQQSIDRVAFRKIAQNGLDITGGNIRINFNEGFKNVAQYFFYFDQADFVYTGVTAENELIMRFARSILTEYHPTDLQYPQKFADFSFRDGRLSKDTYAVIKTNQLYLRPEQEDTLQPAKRLRKRLKI